MSSRATTLEERCFFTMEARDFALNVWGQTLWELKHTTLLVLGNQVIADLEKLKDSMPPDIKDLYEEWKDKGYPVILRSVTARMKHFTEKAESAEIAYRNARLAENKSIIERPSFQIDCTLTEAELKIQGVFDILREERHLSTGLYTPVGVQLLRSIQRRSFFPGSQHLTDELSVAKEMEEMAKVAQKSDQEPYQQWYFAWLPKTFGDLIERLPTGQPKNPQTWKRCQKCLVVINLKDALNFRHVTLPDEAFIPHPRITVPATANDSSSAPTEPAAGPIPPAAPNSSNPPNLKGHKYVNVRGPAPVGLCEDCWDKSYNKADTRIARKETRPSKRLAKAKASREKGETRKEAIRQLMQDKNLPDNFVDRWGVAGGQASGGR